MGDLFPIIGWEHVGIRVSSRERALKFYKILGFKVESTDDKGAIEIINPYGIRLNLIPNADPQDNAHNILLDESTKYPGATHPAFIVANLDQAMAAVRNAGVTITEGPKVVERRRYFFIRDPDGTVLEFNELG